MKFKKDKHQHGADIITKYHTKHRKQYIIEAKGEAGRKPSVAEPIKHNAFYYMLGEILFRMDKEGNKPNRGRIYALAIPKRWEYTFKKKIKQMSFGWKSVGLKVFLVDNKGDVCEKANSYFLR